MIDELIERVEKGEGADRAIDGDIAEMFNPDRFKPEFIRGQARSYTTSLDAVLALIEEKLPGWAFKMERNSADLSWGAVWNRHSDKSAEATSPARALLAAFLRAHKEQHDGR